MSYISSQNLTLRATLVSNFFISELIASSAMGEAHELYLVSPWITNFTLNLPSHSDLSLLVNSSEPEPRLFEVLQQIAHNGGKVQIIIQPEYEPSRVRTFIELLKALRNANPRITVRQNPNLHAKIYVGQYGALHGSLNLTTNGVSQNIELSSYASDTRSLLRLRNEARQIFESGESLL